MNAETLLEAIGEIDVKYAVEARGESVRRRGRRYWWMGAGAAAVLAAALAIILPKGPAGPAEGFTTERVEDLRSITDAYEGTLLAENLLAAGADISDIELVHRRDVDAQDASGWKELTFTAENNGDEMRVTCTFDAPEGFELPGEPDEETEYGGVTVWLYFTPVGEGEGGHDCRAIFINECVIYDMDFHICGDESRDIVREYLELILDAPKEAEGGDVTDALHPLESLMGFTDYKVTVEADSQGSTWHFWLDVDGVETCVAECFGGAGDLGAYSVDLDGDGTPEVVTNNVYGDGVQEVRVFRFSEGVFYVGSVAEEYYDGLGFVTWEWVHAVSERYDPERNVFVVENHPQSAEERTETFTGIEPFAFRRFASSPADHFGTRPLSLEELEPTDVRPIPDLYGKTDYKVGIERTEFMDVWHFFAWDGAEYKCLAEASAERGGTPEVYSADLDGDGVNEFIANDRDGTVRAISYADGRSREYFISGERRSGLQSHGPNGNGKVTERYDPERNEFVLTVTGWGEEEPVYTETFTGLNFGCYGDYRHRLYGEAEYFGFKDAAGEGENGDGEKSGTPEPGDAAEALREVLKGEREFKYTMRTGEVRGSLDIERAGEVMTDGGSEFMAATRFALVDMDGDGVDEAVIDVSKRAGGDEMGFVVLRYSAGEVYGYMFYSRELTGLKEDGTFRGSESASNIEYSRIEFSGLRLEERTFLGSDSYTDWEDDWRHEVYYGAGSEEEYSRLVEEQEEKADVRWVEITGEGVEEALG